MRNSINHISRRTFVKSASVVTSGIMAAPIIGSCATKGQKDKEITIAHINSNFEREPLIRPFGFKGGYMSEIWQTVSLLQSDAGNEGLGLDTQNVLWSDAKVFAKNSEAAGNALMYVITERAMQMVKGMKFTTPIDLQKAILEEVYAYAKKVTSNPDLRVTFALNALVGLDNAAWMLYARENGYDNFDQLIPEAYLPALSNKHDKVASIPLMAYSIPISEITEAVDNGYFFMKIKIGQPGTQQEMLEKDKARLSAIHKAIGDKRTNYTKDGKLPYYFDANGRYEKKDTLLKLLDHAKQIGAFDQIAVIEEPFPEHAEIDVHDIDMRLAADESAHTDKDALERIEMGYRAIALKSIAKTMSMTMKIAQVAHEKDVPCFCADLTVNPILVEWNKVVAARLSAFPGLGGMGLMETNGHQNYKNWEKMRTYHPYPDAEWANTKDGVFNLGKEFYQKSGGILEASDYYMKLVMPPFKKN
ncbi:MAG: L-alanine-DL-glutamate epimerase [Cyclobacteriaceae bacterium]|nr:L-alanine-DL-glutamate epimerase [Cyclobacteriaceae bacterium]